VDGANQKPAEVGDPPEQPASIRWLRQIPLAAGMYL
jgi:hypothetical protein